jgi:hypothetical protein
MSRDFRDMGIPTVSLQGLRIRFPFPTRILSGTRQMALTRGNPRQSVSSGLAPMNLESCERLFGRPVAPIQLDSPAPAEG